jgi:hypothetical protein
MTRQQAEQLLSTLRTYENACAADMEREWCEAKYIADMADYDENDSRIFAYLRRHPLDRDAFVLFEADPE